MKKYLITGSSGFVGTHFIDYLERNKLDADVLGIDINLPTDRKKNYKDIKYNFKITDLLNKEEIKEIILKYRPDYVLHLASFSSVAFSWENPILSFQNNTNIFLNLVDVIRELKINCRILSVGSSEEYGNISSDKIPLIETAPISPISVYAVARVAQENLSRVFVKGYGLDIVLTRSFNHFGPGQRDSFVISSFAKQMVMINKEILKNELICGNTEIIRDFLDVRDVAEAYYLLLQKGNPGEIYNVCSGKGYKLIEILEMMSKCLKIKINIKHDEKLMRPSDNLIIVGSNEKIRTDIGWSPKIPLIESINDILIYWENELSK